jgi:TPR repeat protein
MEAQFMAGRCFVRGCGVELDYNESARWFEKAAEQGYADAQYDVATMYRKGSGVGQDMEEALKWYRAAAENGKAEAAEALEELGETWEPEETDREW